ncbi:hypothetical protein CRE_26854 [Caenorhabditis remanei]|uniref:Serpin domain-containing protein n=1 Tax=Caenorhabditis remanei TaxID=31234 RepID=E3NM24_CAERE|nr:hypothetical protein CRE_26854 [Caenorhabditis remanei]
MENGDVLSSLVSKYYESDMFKIMLKSTIKECMKPLNEKVKALESRLRDLEDKLKVQKEQEEKMPTAKSELEISLAIHLMTGIDTSESFIISPVSIILAIHPFFKSASPQLRLKWAKLLLEGGTPDDMTEYFVDLLSVLRASVLRYEIRRRDGKANDPTIQHLYRNEGYHALEESVFKDFLSTKLKFIELESDEMIVNSINYNPIFDEMIHTFFHSKRTFYSTESSPQTMGFMEWGAHQHHFSEDDTFRMVGIQMRKHISLHIFLPKIRFGLRNALKTQKNGEKLYKLISTAEKKYINIALPRFNINAETDLASFMKSIGIEKELYDIISEKTYRNIPSFVPKSQFELTYQKYNMEEMLYNDDYVDDRDYTGVVDDGAPYCVYFHGTKLDFLADHPFLFMLVKDSHVVYFGCYQ